MTFTAKNPIENFWSKVRRDESGCWLWQAGVDKDGYGKFAVGLGGRRQRHVRAHRFAYEMLVGPISSPQLRHSCDTPACVNPQHLLPGDPKSNQADCVERGRRPATKPSFAEKPCKRDHARTPENVRIDPRTGARTCRPCGALLARERRAS